MMSRNDVRAITASDVTTGSVTGMDDNIKTVTLRIDAALLDEIDARIEKVNARKRTAGERPISRNDWFLNMSRWTCHDLPHQATRANLVKAWPSLPEEALGVEK